MTVDRILPNDEAYELLELVTELADRELAPRVVDFETRAVFPRDVLRTLGRSGLRWRTTATGAGNPADSSPSRAARAARPPADAPTTTTSNAPTWTGRSSSARATLGRPLGQVTAHSRRLRYGPGRHRARCERRSVESG